MYLILLQRKSKKLRSDGAISIYLSLIFSLIVSMFLSAVTAARGAALQVTFECAVESALLSVFGEYNKELLERYDVLFIDMSYLSDSPSPQNLEARLNTYFYDNLHPDEGTVLLSVSDFLDITESNVSLSEYSLATDNFGKAFAKQAVDYMESLVGEDKVKEISDLVSVCDEYEISSDKYEEKRNEILKDVKSYEDEWDKTVIKKDYFSFCDTIPEFEFLIGRNVLELSHETINLGDTLLLREKYKGNNLDKDFDLEPGKNIIFSEYVLYKFGDFLDPIEEDRLQYEAEYVIWGAESDYKNLMAVTCLIYGMRVLEDFISLNMASDKVDEVRIVSELIEVLTGIPETVTTQTLLFIWGCLEAITDIRSLANGEKVKLFKSTNDINVSLYGLVSLAGDQVFEDKDLKSVKNTLPDISLGYKDYLRILMYSIPMPLKVFRTMDLIELNLRKSGEGNEFFRFDACADKVKAVFSIETGFDFRFISEKKYTY